MEHIGERHIMHFIPGTDIMIPLGGLNYITIFNSLVVMAIILLLLWTGARRASRVPSRMQVIGEAYMGMFDNLVSSALELEPRSENRKFLPLISALFAFLLLANFIGFLPTSWFEEPTADLNTTLALGIMNVVLAWYCAIKVKGLKAFAEEMCGPLFAAEDAKGGAAIAGKASALFFLPLNIIGELAKIVSISFRIFGNIMGGAIIIVVVSTLVLHFSWLAVGLNLFFVFFVGTVQAFVFTMLALTYIAVAIK